MTDLVQKLVGALEGKLRQMEMAGDAIEAGRYDEALLYVRSLHSEARSALSAAKDGGWVAVESKPIPRDGGSYLVANAVRGLVAPHIRGVIHNNPGTNWDWLYGEGVTHWQPLPNPPKGEV